MNATNAHARFMLLVACALALVAGLGVMSEIALGHRQADAEATATTQAANGRARGPQARAVVSEARSPSPNLPLAPLLSPHRTDSFPQMEVVSVPQHPALENTQIISYYGSPYTDKMGILGAAEPARIASQIEAHAELYDKLNGSAGVVPALHLVYSVAQPHPTDNGLFLQYADDELIQRYVELVEERDMLLFLDLQIGRSSVAAELKKVLPFLRHPRVHLAIDPEFAVGRGEIPGVHLGEIRAADINWAQAVLQVLVEQEGLPPKLLIVHQFADSMVLDSEEVKLYRNVELIIDMDGVGPAEIKQVKYERYAARPYVFNSAIKLFLEHDPDLMSAEDVLALDPRPTVVIYQ